MLKRLKQLMQTRSSKRVTDILIVIALVSTLGYAVYDRQKQASLESNVCRAPGKMYDLALQDDAFSVAELQVHMCDVVRITNHDSQPYHLNFGTHDEHISYPGFKPLIQNKDETIAIDALQTGDYRLHDHIRDEAVLQLTVLPKR